jgi:hypothetical protein
MFEFTQELVAIRERMQQMQRGHVGEMLWEDPLRACQPFWDVAIPAGGRNPARTADGDAAPPLIVMSAKPYVEPRVYRSRTR